MGRPEDEHSSWDWECEPVQTSEASICASTQLLEAKFIARLARFARAFPSARSSTPRPMSRAGSCVDLQSVEVVMKLK